MIESEQQLEYAEFILSAMARAGGKIERSRMIGLIQKQYNYDPQPELQLEQLIITDGMIEQKGAWLFLTKDGKKAAAKTLKKFLKGKARDERIERWTRYLNFGKAVWWLIGGLTGWFLRDGWELLVRLFNKI